jgi:hypothetical protein
VNTGVAIGIACVSRVNQGHDPALNLAGCVEAVEHPTHKATRADLVEAIAYLAAQVSGYQNSADRNAQLAMHQIGSAVDEYRGRLANKGASDQ